MQKSDETSMLKSSHRKVQASTTLSRKYTKRPTINSEIKIPKSLKISRFGSDEREMMSDNAPMMEPMTKSSSSASMNKTMQSDSLANMSQMMQSESSMSERPIYAPEKVPVYPDYPDFSDDPMSMYPMQESTSMHPMQESAPLHPMQESANMRMKERNQMQMSAVQSSEMPRTSTLSGMTAREMKEEAIKKAVSSASKVDSEQSKKTKKSKKVTGMHFGFGRVMLALTCASVALMAIVYFVNLNMPDISLSVAAMQNGMDVVYPSYIPRDYNISSVTSEEGKVTMVFNNSTENKSFTLIEESSSWDSNALLTNYVKEEYGENYSVIKEQGLTLYVSGSDAAWVNGGNVYKIIAGNGTLTNKQIKSIAVSL